MSITDSITPTINHVDDFIAGHSDRLAGTESHPRFFMNKELLNAIIEREGGTEAFLAGYFKQVEKAPAGMDVSMHFSFDYPAEDNLKFWDKYRDDIIDGLTRHAQHAGEDSAAELVGYWFEDTKHYPADIEAAFAEKACSINQSSTCRKEVCSWLSVATIADAYTDFICYMDGVCAQAKSKATV